MKSAMRKGMQRIRWPKAARGFSLLEMSIAISLAMILMSSLFSLYSGAARGVAREEFRMAADRQGRLIVQRMVREFRMVGYLAPQDINGDSNDIQRDVPGQLWSDTTRQDFEYANTYGIIFTSDVDRDSATETVRYYLDLSTRVLKQDMWRWSRASKTWEFQGTRNISQNVDYIMFRFFDRDGNTIPDPVTYPVGGYTLTAGERVRITGAEVTLVTRADHPENTIPEFLYMPDGTYWHDRVRRSVQRFMVRGRNLDLGA